MDGAAASAAGAAAAVPPPLLSRPFSFSINFSQRNLCTAYSQRVLQIRSRTRLIGMASSSRQTAPSWEELAKELGEAKEGPFRLSHANTRLFENSAPALTFYRDNSSWCPYCERVWLQLEEKCIPYSVEKINMNCYGSKPDWYLQMIPSGLLPAIKLAGKVIPESLDIMMILEDSFPEHKPLLPSKTSLEKWNAVNLLLKQERRLVGAWLSALRGGMWGSMDSFNKAVDGVDASLKQFGGPYFLGQEFSLVDAVYAPFLERISASVPYWLGQRVRGTGKWPALDAWFDAMDSRPAYQAMKSDDFTITHTLEPQIGKCRLLPEGAAYRAKINGKDGSWDLPLKPETTAWGHDDGTGKNNAKLEAARSLISNHEAIVKFASRAFTTPGTPTTTSVDHGFRFVSHALLGGVERTRELPVSLPKEAAVAAAYLRDRVGVPRDLSYPAARQLRAHLHWLVKASGSDL
ncbi:hypothetical protein GOP47_0000653 [Adiantum capillus-veneris]|uniref:GST N-terminal domain-containing protein n=1 Tax=Adiantum capillus-veneris TaxID=13818 RepID=A0A9D4VEA5_ADICA|nr:hypothetical protein GOP47_0000653 [Adiantum capillus-veneris]